MFENKKILTIDDSQTIRAFLRGLLGTQRASVDEAATGEEGLALLAGRTYDLVLLDLILPDIPGIELLQRLRERDEESTVVMLTGSGDVKSATVAVRHGADGYLQKQDLSFAGDHEEFFYAIQQALAHRAGIVAQKQLEQVRADFYSMVTHDLRNPASAILITTEMLLEDDEATLSPDQLELIGIIQRSAEKFLELINNYLDFAKIDAGYLRLDRHETELRSVAQQAAQLVQKQAQSKDQTLLLHLPKEPVLAYADARRLEQVLDNLLSNANKYTSAGGTLALTLTVEGENASFAVSDTGIGIPETQLSSLFTKYHRVPGEATRGIRGTGLGLLIVKEITEAHGGTVLAQSEGVEGKGSTFTVTIPLNQDKINEWLEDDELY